MRFRFLIQLIIFSLISGFSFGQLNYFTVSGSVTKKENKEPLKGVSIFIEGTGVGTTTNDKGEYSIKYWKSPIKIMFTHVGRKEEFAHIKVSENQNVDIQLDIEAENIPPVDISGKKIVIKVVKSKSLVVQDYELTEDYLVFIAHHPGRKAKLVYMDYKLDTICYRELVETPDELFKDCMDNIHLITEKNAYQIHYEDDNLMLLYPEKRKVFYEMMPLCVEELGNKYYIQQYISHDQIIHYYYYNKDNEERELFKVVADEEAMWRINDLPRLRNMPGGWTEHDQRFEEMFFMDPIFAPLHKVGDSIIIFNYVDSKLEFYDIDARFVREVQIDFQNQKNWKEEVYIDEVTNKAYTLIRRTGISRIYEINLTNGKLGAFSAVPEFKFIDNIRVHNGIAWFMYTNRLEGESRMLYRMKL